MQDVAASGRERRWTAVLMADMAGSTAITEQIGTEKAYQLLSKLVAMAVAAVEAEGGTALTFGGDSLLASFGAPVAIEDASLRACRAALAFQAAIAAEGNALEERFGIRPGFRIGISGGMVVVGHLGPNAGMDLNIMGQPVNAASRLQEMAEPAQILLSDTMYEQVAGEVEVSDLGLHVLKGIAGKAHVFALHKTLASSERFAGRIRRGLVDMVGRRAQLGALHQAIAHEAPGWHLALIEGPPGIGKSRLLHDLRLSLQGERVVLQGQCRAGANAPYQPLADILIAASLTRPSAGNDAVIAGLRDLLGDNIALEPLRHLLSSGRDMAPSNTDSNFALTLRAALRDTLTRLFDALPCVMVIEDVHWMDRSTRSLIKDLLRERHSHGRARPLLLTSRPEGVSRWASLPPAWTVPLSNLSEAESADLAALRLRNARLSPGLARLLYEKSEGNPLFIEEISRYLDSTDALVETTAGLALRPGAGRDLASGNLQHLVMARVDALPATLRQTLRLAAVQGRQFCQNILEAVEQKPDLSANLAEAADRGLIEKDPSRGETAWRFRHALLHDAIYGSLLEDSRQPMHARIADAIEARHSDRREEMCEILAHHFVAAGRAEQAVPYLILSAQKALRIYDLDEVERLSMLLRDMLRDNPKVMDQSQLDRMAVTWMEAASFKGNFTRVIELGETFLPKLRAGGNERATEIAMSHYATALSHAHDYQQAIALAQNGIAQAESRGDTMSAAWLRLPLLRAYEETDCLPPAEFRALAEQTLAQAEALGETRLKMQILYMQSAHYRSQGKVRLAHERCMALHDFAIAQNDQRGQGLAAWSQALLYQISEDIEIAVQRIEKAKPMALPGMADAHVMQSVWAANTVLGPNPYAGREALDAMIALARDYQYSNMIDGTGLIDAIYYLRIGKISVGWARLGVVLANAHRGGNIGFSRYFHLMRAEMLLTIAGIRKKLPPEQNIPDRSVKPAPKLALRDIATLIRLRFGARKKAAADLAYFRANFQSDGGGVLEARVLFCESLMTSDKAARRAGLQQAADLAAAEGVTLLQRLILAHL